MVFRRVWLYAFLLSIIFALAGCSTTAGSRKGSDFHLDLTAKGTEGFVVLKVVATRPISLLNPKWQSIRVQGSVTGAALEMDDITPIYNMLGGKHVPTESLYFAKLPAGNYDVTSLGSIGPGPGLMLALLMSDRQVTTSKLPQFQVVPGALANLGTMVFSPEYEKELQSKLVLLGGDIGKSAALEDLLAEADLSDLPLGQAGGWLEFKPNDESALVDARNLVSMLSLRTDGLSGAVSAGSQMGQMFEKSAKSEWTGETIGTLTTIRATARLADGTLLAGGDYGRYYIKMPGAQWKSSRVAREKGRVVHIEPRDDGTVLFFLGDLRQTRMVVKKALSDPSEQLVPSLVMEAPPDNLMVVDNDIVFAWNEPGFTRKSHFARIDKQTLQIKKTMEPFWVIDWQKTSASEVLLTRMNGMSTYRSTSIDALHTWKHTEMTLPFGPRWIDSSEGYALDISPGFRMVKNTLKRTSDGGQTWVRLGTPLETEHFAGRIVSASSGELLVQGSNMLFSTRDQGNTWQRVFPRSQTPAR